MYGLKKIVFCLLLVLAIFYGSSQCISNFPNTQDFETSPSWTTNGLNTDWAWGTPTKSNINSASSGSKCWVVGGLSGSNYNSGEKSYIESPCYDFSNLTSPYVSFKVFWETEYKYDGASLLYSTNNGATWNLVGLFNEPANCMTQNWYNYNAINFLAWSNMGGWSGNSKPTTGSCQGGNGSLGWVTAKHCLSGLAGHNNVKFRFNFGSGTSCNTFDGFAIDDFTIADAGAGLAQFTYTCSNFSVITPTCASPTLSYHWNFGEPNSGAANTSTLSHPAHTYNTTGIYSVILNVSGGPCNSISTSTQQVSIIGSSVSILSNVSCFGGNNGSASASALNGHPSYTYTWLPYGGNNAVATGLAAGTYTVLLQDVSGCINSNTVSILQPSISTGATSQTITNCLGDTTILAVNTSGITDPINYLWQPGSFTSNSISVSPLITTTYSVNVVVSGTCPQNEQKLFTVEVVPKPTVKSINGNLSGCAPFCVNFIDKSYTPSGSITNTTWSFNSNSTTSINPIICFDLPGTYKGIHSVTNSFGCTTTINDFATITVFPTPIAQFEINKSEVTEQDPLVTFKDQSLNNPTLLEWNFDGTIKYNLKQTSYTFNSLGLHPVILTVSNSYGCTNSTIKVINVLPEFTFFVPNTFSPNDDGLNDVFLPFGMGWNAETYKMFIYNRWGQKIFYSSDISVGWNGKAMHSDVVLPIGDYVYKIEVTDIFKKQHQFIGSITLLN